MIGCLDHCLKVRGQFASWNMKHFLHPAQMLSLSKTEEVGS